MLYHIIAILILNEVLGVRVQFGKNGRCLFSGAMLKNALNHPTSIWMGAQGVHLAGKCVYNELECTGLNAFDAFLYDMVAILIFDTFQNVTVELAHNFLLLIGRNAFEGLLNDPATVHL